MSWRLAKSLIVLRSEIDAVAPNRSKASDGTIGDDAHQASDSDHNINDEGVVCAIDFTHDPGDGADMHEFAEHIRKTKHRAVKYVIWNRRIWSKARDAEGWRAYKGKNPHTKHMHVSAGVGDDGHSTGPYDDTSSWGIGDSDTEPTPSKPSKPSKPTTGTKLGDKMPTLKRGSKGRAVRILQGLLCAWGFKVSIDGIFGEQTERQVKAFQAKYAKPVDGIPGPVTWGKLLGQ
jgi:hypothetical protein